MKLIKLFEEFIAEAANSDYTVGEYDYSYVDKDFKPLGQPLKLKVTSVPELDNPEADWLMVILIDHKRGLELYPLDPETNPSIKTARPDIFSHPNLKEADHNGTPNPWPAGTAYIKIYKKGELQQVGKAGVTPPRVEVVDDCLVYICTAIKDPAPLAAILAGAKNFGKAGVTPTEEEWAAAQTKFFDVVTKGLQQIK